MPFFQQLSVKQKIIAITLTVSTLSLLFALSLVTYNSITLFKKDFIANSETLADMLAFNSAPALLLSDSSASQQVIEFVTNDETVIYAAAFTVTGETIAEYNALPEQPHSPHTSLHEYTGLHDGYLEVVKHVEFNGAPVGYILLHLDNHLVEERQTVFVYIFIFTFFIAIVLAFLLANYFQKTISKPVNQLISVARQITQDGNYNKQIQHDQHAEFGELLDAFNTMLSTMSKRDIQLTKANLSLLKEKEIAESQRQEALLANKAKSQFLSAMSHELRTPLNAILGFAQLLESDTVEPLTQDQTDSVKTIITSGQHLLSLINEVLDLAKIESGKTELQIETVDLQTAISHITILLRSDAERANITLNDASADLPSIAINVDHRKFIQVLLNIGSNAIKYNVPNGSVHFSYETTAENKVRILIRDTGKGVQPSDLDKLFEPFNRLEHTNSNIPGTGIGLTICKQLIELMHGQIGVYRNPDQGLTFWLEFEQA
jgi:signal transduction histidine kinase